MEGIITIIGFLLVVVIIIFLILKRAHRILEDWAAQNDYQILSSEVRWLRKGPFLTWRTSRNQIVYYITVRTLDGTIKDGWVRCGGFWLVSPFSSLRSENPDFPAQKPCTFQNKAEVRWDD